MARKKATQKSSEKKCKTFKDKMALTFDMLTKRELTVAKVLNGKGTGSRVKMLLEEISTGTRWKSSLGVKKSNWTVRNALRRLVRGGWVEHVDRGTYRISTTGRTQLKKGKTTKKTPKKATAKKPATKKTATKKNGAKKVAVKKTTKAGGNSVPPRPPIPETLAAQI